MSIGVGREGVKVVIINTQYVHTDPMSFKTVVQKLTGKDSVMPLDSETKNYQCSNFQGPNKEEDLRRRGVMNREGPVLGRDLSFRDFERLLQEMPPLYDMII